MPGAAETSSVVVSTYDEGRWDDLAACLRSLQEQASPPLETILVVDHNPMLLERARAAFPRVRVIANERRRGLAGARNAGAAVARGEIVAFIDDDARAEPDWLERLGECFADSATVGAGGALIPRWTGPQPPWLPPEFHWVIGCSYTGLPAARAPIRNPIGANMAVRASILRQVGGFREGASADAPHEIRSRGVVRAGGNVPDDTDLAIRVSQRRPGAVWIYEPRARVHHTVTPERASFGYFLRRCWEEGAGKAHLARYVGSRDGLRSERSHLARALPRGLGRDLRDLVAGERAGGLRGGAILIGALSTAAGFLVATVGDALRRDSTKAIARSHPTEPASPEFAPVRMDDIEVGAPLEGLPPGETETGTPFATSLCLVRLHGRPLGLVEVALPPGGLAADGLAARIQADLGEEVARHLRDDGLPPAEVRPEGIEGPGTAPCAAAREDLLTRAPTVSVVVVTRGRPQRVLKTVRSITGCRYPKDRYDVIVVDTPEDGEPPLGFEPGQLDEDVSLRVVVEPRPGISRARNTGLREATGELVVFADDDVDVDPDWLATLIAAFELGERVDAVSGPTLPGSLETPTERWFEGFGGLQRGFETRVYSLADPPPDQPLFPFTPGALGSGRSMAFRRDRLRRLGGFDPALGPPTPTLAGEDIEALLRVVLSGSEVVHEPAALVWHAHPREYRTLRRRMWGYGLGLSACLTKSLAEHPRLLPTLLRKLPGGLAFALSPRSDKNRKRQGDYPAELIRLELAGLACGPLAYARSRWQQRGDRDGRLDSAPGAF